MTEQEAIEYFTNDFPNYIFETPSEKQLAYNTAIEILKEIQEYRSLGTVEELKELKKKSEWIHSNITFHKDEIEFIERIEKALGFKLFLWQKTYIESGIYRRYGKTTAECLKRLLDVNAPIDYTMRPASKREACHRDAMLEIKTKLEKAGIETAPIFSSIREKKRYVFGVDLSNTTDFTASGGQLLPRIPKFQTGGTVGKSYIAESED